MTGIDRPILFDFPAQFETARLLLCAPKLGDGKMINEAIVESHAELKPWLTWADPLPSPELSEETNRLSVTHYIQRKVMRMNVIQKSDGLFVGVTSLHHIDWSVPAFEIGYWVRTSLAGKGYAKESVQGITDFAFSTLKAERIEIRCDTRNDRSAAVAQRACYTLEGHSRHDMREKDDTLSDAFIFGMIRPEWETLRQNAQATKVTAADAGS
ncbi:MAG: GNAT family protein [Chloroflexota bacterium]